LIGYCPQQDAIFPLMTVIEHLQFYAKIKGIPEFLHCEIIDKTISELSLEEFRFK
jgi:ABC-type multidrug transport system ATPase subunit